MFQETTFGRLVREKRRTLDLTQEELAHRVGCAPVTLRKIEYDSLRPSVQIAERLAMALGIPLEERAAFVHTARASLRPDKAPTPTTTPAPAPEEIGLEDLSGRAIRGYALGDRIGAGGFGAVYRAVQPLVDREVAIKIILPQYANHSDFIRRFEAEAQLVARLEHPYIVPLYDYWREPGVAYLVMRLLRGGNVQSRLNNGPLSIDTFERVIDQIGSALYAAHRAGVIHRDLKPANVLLDEDGNAYLADFGIAKNLGNPNPEDQTLADALIGSPAYASPEQIRSESVRPQTDIYCLGVLMYELLTGHKPFHGPTPIDFIQQHLSLPVPSLSLNGLGLPAALDEVIAHATAKNPAERYNNVLNLLEEVHQALGPRQLASTGHVPIQRPLTDSDNPYKGLRAFAESDADDFFGREALVQQLLVRLGETGDLSRFLAIIGPSGSGKSSVVRAGLVPALRRGALPDSENWFIVELVPGSQPFEEIEAALLRIAVNPPPSLLSQLLEDERGLLRAARRCLPDDPRVELVLVIDQFEELFTLTNQESTRALLLESLVTAVLEERSRVRVVVTLRADFVDRPLSYVDFGELFRQRTEFVLPLTSDELELAISGPAERVGLTLESGLTAAMMSEVGGQPGALPLLQYTLAELFERRELSTLTRAAYQSLGGVVGALAKRADEVFTGLDQAHQQLALHIFLRLITLGEGVEDTRRRVAIAEIESLASDNPNDPPDFTKVLEVFGKSRLLTFDHDPVTRGPTVEVAHEALLREWPRLHGWLTDWRAAIRLQRQLAQAAQEWTNAGQDASFLLAGARLAQFESWAATSSLVLTAQERAYLQASQAERQRLLAAEQDRQHRELAAAHKLAETERQSAGRLRLRNRLISAVGGLALVAAIIAALLGGSANQAAQNNATLAAQNQAIANQNGLIAATAQAASTQANLQRAAALNAQATAQSEAESRATQQVVAQTNFANAESQRLAAEANGVLQRGESAELAALLAIRGLQAQYSPQADAALQRASRFDYGKRLFITSERIYSVAFAPDGQSFVAASANGNALMFDVITGQALGELKGHTAPIQAISYSLDGKLIVTAGDDKTARIWDAVTHQQLHLLGGHTDVINKMSLSNDGNYVLTLSLDNTIRLWSVQTGAQLQKFEVAGPIAAIFTVDSKSILAIDDRNNLHQWDVATGQPLHTFNLSLTNVSGFTPSPDGKYLLTYNTDKLLRLWDLGTGRLVRTFSGHTEIIFQAVFSPDGKQLLTGSLDTTARLWDVASGQELRRFTAHTASVYTVAFAPDGQSILTGGKDGTVRLWDIDAPVERDTFAGHSSFVFGLAFSPNGQLLITGSADGTAHVWDLSTGQRLYSLSSIPRVDALDVSPDGQWVLTNGEGAIAQLWDLKNGSLLRTFGLPNGNDLGAFTPNGQAVLTMAPNNQPSVTLWNATTGQEIRTFVGLTAGLSTAAISPDGNYLVTGADNGDPANIQLWDIKSGQLRLALQNPGGAMHVVFSPDGLSIAAASRDNIGRLWDTRTGQLIREFVGHTNIIWRIAISPNGQYLLTASQDKSARLWDMATGQQVRLFPGHGNASVASAIFSPDGKTIVVGSFDGVAQQTETDIDTLVRSVCARLLRDFTPGEKIVYSIQDDRPTCPNP